MLLFAFAAISLFPIYHAKEPLRFNQNGSFKISQFADLHYGEAPDLDWGPQQDVNSSRVITNVLLSEKPDLVVLSGDQITGEFMFPNATSYYRQILDTIRSAQPNANIASCFGNHDAGPRFARSDLMNVEVEYDTYSQFGPKNITGISNYYLPVYHSYPIEKPALILWFLDSNGNASIKNPEDWVTTSQIQWLVQQNQVITSMYGIIPSILFVHIPTIEFNSVYDPAKCIGLNGQGGNAVQGRDLGFFNAVASLGTVKSIFVGHDHGSGWCCKHPSGIQLCFGRHSGYGGYGDWDRGSRIVEFRESDLSVFDTWIRMENGDVIDKDILPLTSTSTTGTSTFTPTTTSTLASTTTVFKSTTSTSSSATTAITVASVTTTTFIVTTVTTPTVTSIAVTSSASITSHRPKCKPTIR